MSEHLGRSGDCMPLKKEDRPPGVEHARARHAALELIARLRSWLGSVVRRSRPAEPSARSLFEEATVVLHSLQDDFDAANWEELSQRLDHVNELLRGVVEDIARRTPPRRPG